MSIRIITHCYASERPQYAVMLRSQLSSLVRFRPTVPVTITVCFTPSDSSTLQVLEDFNESLGSDIVRCSLEPSQICRRAIGRNMMGLQAKENIVWFADADYYFGDGCLDALSENFSKRGELETMAYPVSVETHKSHNHGVEFWKRHADARGEIHPEITEFSTESVKFPIGGVQIVSGYYARTKGYLNGHPKWQSPATGGWVITKEDQVFRKLFVRDGGVYLPLQLPNLLRLRHGYAEAKRST